MSLRLPMLRMATTFVGMAALAAVATLDDVRWLPLGAILTGSGLVSVAQLEESLEAQRHHGGRLGTVLAELGLLVPAGTHEPPPQHGIVLAVGPGLDWWESAGITMPVKPGDHVVFPASAGAWVEVDEERLLVCRVGELLGVLDEVADEVPA